MKPRPGRKNVRKPWAGRFTQSTDPTAERFTGSLAFDRRLWPWDITGSVAWAKALGRAGLLTASERDTIVRGLDAVREELATGTFPFRPELEDIHTNVERRLHDLVGDVAGKLHTGRSRNDQIALDERLYLKDVAARVAEGLRRVQEALVARAAETVEAPLPGYTHLQRAQPVVLAHHLLAYVFMLQRDRERFRDARARADVLPLGAAALAGTAFPIDREALAQDLGFAAVSPNSLDAVSDRDYVLEFLAAGALAGMHFSRLAADLTLWATAEFGFVEFSDAFATGSSIMPQKKNPDVAELIRGKSGRLYGNLVAVLTTMKGLPLAYNSDMQEDKEPFFDSVDTLEAIVGVLPPLLAALTFRTDRMRRAAGEHFSTATDLADYLVRKGLPFRQAHEVVGRLVRYALDEGKTLEDLTLPEFRRFSPLIDGDVKDAITVEASLRARAVTGGTAPAAVRRTLALARTLIAHG
ncbi:MAG: argininosuccinate lyase [Candidatus Rokubacteria bacterium 13_1_40CM_2_70_45]|nr:MAG: argininosuccinate lyase [Candidatus Rokubacteria bacterium 13_1_40CM_2_70_45]